MNAVVAGADPAVHFLMLTSDGAARGGGAILEEVIRGGAPVAH